MFNSSLPQKQEYRVLSTYEYFESEKEIIRFLSHEMIRYLES